MPARTPRELLQAFYSSQGSGGGDPAAAAARRDLLQRLAEATVDSGGAAGAGGAGIATQAIAAARDLGAGLVDV